MSSVICLYISYSIKDICTAHINVDPQHNMVWFNIWTFVVLLNMCITEKIYFIMSTDLQRVGTTNIFYLWSRIPGFNFEKHG